MKNLMMALVVSAWTASAAAGQGPGPEGRARLLPFAMRDVRLLEGEVRDARELNRALLLSLDPERLLKTFRMNAGLPAPGEPLGHWESPESRIRGQFVGHYLSALAQMYAATGDEALKERGDSMVAELHTVQEALGGGFLAAWPESFATKTEDPKVNTWATYYGLHKTMAGLFDQYRHAGNQEALDVLKNMVSWLYNRLEPRDKAYVDSFLEGHEQGGITEPLWDLYAVTGDPRHKALADKLESRPFFEDLFARRDTLAGRHGNSHIPLVVAAARRYEVTGDRKYRDLAEYFWGRVVPHRTYCTGGTTWHERWFPADELSQTLGFKNQEFCKTYNMQKLTRHLFMWSADPAYMEYYERTFYNLVLGSCDPETGDRMYYVPLADGYQKTVMSRNGHFYCCMGTGVESFSTLNDSIYFHDGNDLYVTLYIPSELRWRDRGVRITQRGELFEGHRVGFQIEVESPVSFRLNLRIPLWVDGAVEVAINGEPCGQTAVAGEFLGLDRTWRDGDQVVLNFPIGLHTSPMPDDPDFAAVMYGPLVLAGITEEDDSGHPYRMAPGTFWPRMQRKPSGLFFIGSIHTPEEWLQPDDRGAPFFRTVDQPTDLAFIPFKDIRGERYGVYWNIVGRGTPDHQAILSRQAEAQAELADPDSYASFRRKREIDRVDVGEEASEAAHGYSFRAKAFETKTGTSSGRSWRSARGSLDYSGRAFLSYELKCLPDECMTLAVTYAGRGGDECVDIYVNGEKIARQSLACNWPDWPGGFRTVEYAIPFRLTSGREQMTVWFIPPVANVHTPQIYECQVLRPPVARGTRGGSNCACCH